MSRRRLTLLALAVLALLLISVPVAHAAAGGGSSGFGGGGGGEGGGGRGAGLYILIQILIRVAIFGHGLGALILIGLVILVLMFTSVAPRVRAFWSASESQGRASRRRTAQRDRRVGMAAAEAAEDDPAFAADVVKRDAARLFSQIQAAWDAGDRDRLRRLVSPELMAEWERRLDDFERRGWRNRTKPIGEPTVEYVGLSHRGERDTDRVVVRIEAKLRDYVEDHQGHHVKRAGRLSETIRVREFWTLRRSQGRWMLASISRAPRALTHSTSRSCPPLGPMRPRCGTRRWSSGRWTTPCRRR